MIHAIPVLNVMLIMATGLWHLAEIGVKNGTVAPGLDEEFYTLTLKISKIIEELERKQSPKGG
jgi:hypothetical protein